MALIWPELGEFADDIHLANTLEANHFYSRYLSKQEADIQSYKRDLQIEIPADFPYHELRRECNLFFVSIVLIKYLTELSNEEREKLEKAKPTNLAAASKISGITPSSLILLHKHFQKKNARVSSDI